jgi:hypothetical protein
MIYECPRCNYQTTVCKYMKSHCERKQKCYNILHFDDSNIQNLYEYIILKTHREKKKILKKLDQYECPYCFRIYTCHSSAYRHLKTCKGKDEFEGMNKPDFSKSSTIAINICNSNIINNTTQNNFFILTPLMCPFEKEDMSHIDKNLILDIIVQDNSNIFSRIHSELIKNPINYNIFIESSKSRKVSVFTEENKIERKNTIDALSLRIKSIYDKTKVIIKNILEKSPIILTEIYESDPEKFSCDKNDIINIYKTLNEIIDYRFIQYNKKPESVDDSIHQNRANLRLIMDLIELRGATRSLFAQIQ